MKKQFLGVPADGKKLTMHCAREAKKKKQGPWKPAINGRDAFCQIGRPERNTQGIGKNGKKAG